MGRIRWACAHNGGKGHGIYGACALSGLACLARLAGADSTWFGSHLQGAERHEITAHAIVTCVDQGASGLLPRRTDSLAPCP